jgi:hypothetical protein
MSLLPRRDIFPITHTQPSPILSKPSRSSSYNPYNVSNTPPPLTQSSTPNLVIIALGRQSRPPISGYSARRGGSLARSLQRRGSIGGSILDSPGISYKQAPINRRGQREPSTSPYKLVNSDY